MLKESELKILNYLTLDEDGAEFVSQIARDVGISKGEVSKAIQVLKHGGFVKTELKGRNMVCSVKRTSVVSQKLRMAFNLLEVMPKLESLKKYALKIVLFGSCAQGVDIAKSDIDIFVITKDKIEINKAVQKIKFSRPAQWIVKTPQEYVILNIKERVFAEEIGKGITLWETDETT
ncbi:MAG: nucleotidyltransferase domain-containing protein [Candidatus Omnitrophica bacterium]|nr:nucleotidyltransferase domain-containing protein [Candidatus Omnitrophota bacterium]